MDRRQLIKSLLATSSLAMSPSLLAQMTMNAHKHHMAQKDSDDKTRTFKFLSKNEAHLVSKISEIIIPRTDTPGANDVGVTEFIDLMLADWYDDKDSWYFIEGLRRYDRRLTQKHYRNLSLLSAEKSKAEITLLDSQVMQNKEEEPSIQYFYKRIKELTLIGFYTSEQGMENELNYSGPIAEFNFGKSGPPGSFTRY
ncbi:gluconate 2-dehydrogenase subunit 3 family protein [Paraglaciecola arctica]|uniref:gluconate 2-dehydrogenase subunit 3 family protein n=1 Tax=Paraglaciecola arctica TaxID=1128911 RepID=UPI001C07293C|nr:gluconate 2-dehydrogenase subunit 3 family protein [Paraglaciecola arctica]MBU3004247.1 gluconate 2-dehydrogenase subunit 3 family protein [Paraglaciecola arctica]